jgi:DNA-binding transcriptional LysR family regulator
MVSPFPFDFDLLRSFVAVAENRGFTRAAARVGRTQSTVSLQIKKLEDSLARPLFERGSRDLHLTSDGEMLLVFARQILKLAEEARMSMMEADVEGSVRLGTPEDFATVYLPNVLAQFARTHPRIVLDVNCNFSANLLEGFSRGEYDLVLIKREPAGPVGGIAVWRDVLVWVGSPGFKLDPGQPVPLVLGPAPDVYRKRALSALESVKIPWRVVFTSPSSEGLLAAVRAGLGVTVLSKDMVPEGFLLMDTHHGLPILPDAEIALYQAPGKASRASQLLSDVIINALEISPTRRA